MTSTGQTRSAPGMDVHESARRAPPARDDPDWILLWNPLPVDGGDDIAVWGHNYTGQQVAIRRDGDGTVVVEGRHGDLIDVLASYDDVDQASAFAVGFMQGHLDGEVIDGA